MKVFKIKVMAIITIILLSITLCVNADTSDEIAENVIEDYLESYMEDSTPSNLKLTSYDITEIQVVEQSESEMIVMFSATIEPESENYSWADTNLHYYFRISKNNDVWEVIEKATSPITLSTETYDENNSKSIVYYLAEEKFKEYQQEEVPDNLKLRFYEITNINITSENNSEIIATYDVEIIPYSDDTKWTATELFYNIKVQKVDDEWEIIKQTTDSINQDDVSLSSTVTTIAESAEENDYAVSTAVSIQTKTIITIIIVALIVIMAVIRIVVNKKK